MYIKFQITFHVYFEEHPFNRAPFYLSILTDILNSLVRLLLLRHYPDSEDEFLDFFISLINHQCVYFRVLVLGA